MNHARFRFTVGGWFWYNQDLQEWVPVQRDQEHVIGDILKHTLGFYNGASNKGKSV